MKYVEELYKYLLKANARPNGRRLRRKERSLERGVFADFQTQKEWIVKQYKKKLLKKALKAIEDDIDDIFDDLDDEKMINDCIDAAQDSMKFGATYQIGKQKLGRFGITFDLDHPLAVEYLQTDRPLVLAKMSDTTKELIKPLLQAAAEAGTSPQELATLLSDEFAFSRTRSLMIAVNEIGHAYEMGNWIPMNDLVNEGYTVKKKWSTVNDDRVTEECKANQDMGWIEFEEDFDSGDDQAPRDGNPRCRCTTLYQTLSD